MFKYLILTMAFALSWMYTADASAAQCKNAHRFECPAFIDVEVEVKKVDKKTFKTFCDHKAEACANLRPASKSCVIYHYIDKVPRDILKHEMNHCRGWFHYGDTERAHSKPWVDYKTYMSKRGR